MRTLAVLLVLAALDSTVQDPTWQNPPDIKLMCNARNIRTPSPSTAAGTVGAIPVWDPLHDQLFGSVISSPVTDSDSDVRTVSGSGTWAAAAGYSLGADEWQLPPAFGATEDDGSVPGTEPVTEESAGSCEEGVPPLLRRRCDLCKLMDATRGVAEMSDSGRWMTRVCRRCSQFIKSTIALSTRCQGCRRYATFGPAGGSRRDARHCKRHRQPYEINVSKKRCDFKLDCAKSPLLDRHATCPNAPFISFKGSNYCSWHARDVDLRGGEMSASISVLPVAQNKPSRQCIRDECHLTASFGDAEKGAILCSFHREPQHVDLIHKKRCEHGACERNPAYGLPSEGLARFCKEHHPGSYIDLRSRKCQWMYGCGKRPSFGDTCDGIARFCMEHKLRQHVNVKSRFNLAPLHENSDAP